MKHRWRTTSLITEGLRNVAVGGVPALLLVIVVGATLAAAISADAVEAVDLRAAEARAWSDGSHVTVVTADEGIDARRCERLAAEREVLAAGALRVPREDELTRLGETGIGVVDVTAGVVDLLEILGDIDVTAAWPEYSAIVPSSTSDSLGLRVGERVEINDTSTVFLTDVVDTALLTNQFSTGLLSVTTPGGDFDGCLLLAAPHDRPDVRDILAGTVATTEQWQATELRGNVASWADLDMAWRSRTTRLLAPSAGLVTVAVWAALLVGRRSEAGLYRSLGLQASHVTVIRVVEFALLAVVGVACSMVGVAAMAIVGDWPIDILHASIIRSTGLFTGIAAAGVPLVTLALSAGQGIQLVKDI